MRDLHAVAILGLLDDFGANGRPVVAVPWLETSRLLFAERAIVIPNHAELAVEASDMLE